MKDDTTDVNLLDMALGIVEHGPRLTLVPNELPYDFWVKLHNGQHQRVWRFPSTNELKILSNCGSTFLPIHWSEIGEYQLEVGTWIKTK
jgi:hypothetical protein